VTNQSKKQKQKIFFVFWEMLHAAVHCSGLIYVDLTSSPHVHILYVAPLAFFLYCDDDQLGLFSGFPFLNLHVNQCHFLSSYSDFPMHGALVLFVKQKELAGLDSQPVKNTSYSHPYG
jgi:hypothetical protein